MARVHYETRLKAGRTLGHTVDIPVPEGGLGGRLNRMHAGKRTSWRVAQHHHSIWLAGRVPEDYVRFYFATAEDAELFRWKWVLQVSAPSDVLIEPAM